MTAITQPRMILYRPRRGFRGLGQAADVQEGGTYVPPPPSPQTYYSSTDQTPGSVLWASLTTPTASSGAGTPASTTSNWVNLLSNAITTAGRTAQVALSPLSALPAGSYYQNTPYGTVVATGGGGATSALLGSNLTSMLSSMMPILLIGGVVVLVITMAKK